MGSPDEYGPPSVGFLCDEFDGEASDDRVFVAVGEYLMPLDAVEHWRISGRTVHVVRAGVDEPITEWALREALGWLDR